MAKRRARPRTRRRNPRGRQVPKPPPVDPLDEFEKLGGTDAYIRLLAADDPAADLLRSLIEGQNTELPVALIEPCLKYAIQHKEDFYDIGMAIATKMGLPLAGSTGLCLAAGWALGPRQGKWELTDPTQALVAGCKVLARDAATEPAWTARAMTLGQMLIAYGSEVGVRVPRGVPASHYYNRAAIEELGRSLADRQVCVAIVGLSPQIEAFRAVGGAEP